MKLLRGKFRSFADEVVGEVAQSVINQIFLPEVHEVGKNTTYLDFDLHLIT